MVDSIPVLSQVKSLIQFIGNDTEGAEKTQEIFLRTCPGFSQGTCIYYDVIKNDPEEARQVALEFVSTMSDVADGIPVVGHVKGFVHYVSNDKEGAKKAFLSATRATAVIAGGTVGLLAGPAGAVSGAIAGGCAMDVVVTAVNSLGHDEPHLYGVLHAAEKVVDDIREDRNLTGSLVDCALIPLIDGVCGLSCKPTGLSIKGPNNLLSASVKNVLKQTQKVFPMEVAAVRTVVNVAAKNPIVLATAGVNVGGRMENDSNSNYNKGSQGQSASKGKHKPTTCSNSGNGSDPYRDGSDPNRDGCGNDQSKVSPELKRIIRRFCLVFGELSIQFVSIGGRQIFKDVPLSMLKKLGKLLKRIENGCFDFNSMVLCIAKFAESWRTKQVADFCYLFEFVLQFTGEVAHEFEIVYQNASQPFYETHSQIPRDRLARSSYFASIVLDVLLGRPCQCLDFVGNPVSMQSMISLFDGIMRDVKKHNVSCDIEGLNLILINFDNVTSGTYHYFKHRKLGNIVLTVKDYFLLIKRLAGTALNSLKGKQYLSDPTNRYPLVWEEDLKDYGATFRIVLRYTEDGKIEVVSLYHLDK